MSVLVPLTMAKTSPTQRTLKVLRAEGADVCIVEKWNPYARIRQDAFGFIDLLAIRNGSIIGIQVTSGSNHGARVKKIKDNPISVRWILADGILEVRSWSKKGKRGEKKKWVERIEQLEV